MAIKKTTINDSPDWTEKISAIERTDRVLGGTEGSVNRVVKDLADRTAYLRAQLAVVSLAAGSYGTLAATLKTRLDRIEGVVDPGDFGGPVGLPFTTGISTSSISLVKEIEAGQAVTLPVNEAEFFEVTLTAPLCTVRLDAFVRVTDKRVKRKVDVLLRQGSGANLVTWPSAIRWPYNRPPVLSYGRGYGDAVTLETTDEGNTWIGYYAGGWINV